MGTLLAKYQRCAGAQKTRKYLMGPLAPRATAATLPFWKAPYQNGRVGGPPGPHHGALLKYYSLTI